MRIPRRSAGAIALVLVAIPALAAIEFIRPSMDGGGGTSSGGSLSLIGTIGQPDAGAASGGSLELHGGFWAGSASATAVGDESPLRVNRLHAAAPNPFNPATSIRFELAQDGPATVRIYNTAGRLVRELHHGELPAGSHELRWRGRDDNGRGVASGTYLVHMRAANFAAVRKLALVK